MAAGSLLVMPYAWTYEHALLLVPLVLLFARAHVGWIRWSLWGALAIALPWGLYWAATRTDSDVLSALVPAMVGLAYLAVAGTRSGAAAALAKTEPGTEGTG